MDKILSIRPHCVFLHSMLIRYASTRDLFFSTVEQASHTEKARIARKHFCQQNKLLELELAKCLHIWASDGTAANWRLGKPFDNSVRASIAIMKMIQCGQFTL